MKYMFDKTKEICDILQEKINEGDEFEELKRSSSGDNQYISFIHYYNNFLENMIFQLDLYQITTNDQVNILYESIIQKINKKSARYNKNYLSFILRSINKMLNFHPNKYELISKLLFLIIEKYDKNDEVLQEILLNSINNFHLIRELFENNFLSFQKFKNRIRKKDLLFYMVYLRDKIEKQEYLDWVQSLLNSKSQFAKKTIDKLSKLNENEIEFIKTQRENQNQIAILIRNDDFDKFLETVCKFSISIDSTIPKSRNEMNKLFKKSNRSTYVNYSAFYGSVKIFRYLISNKARCDEDTLKCACAGGNTEIIRILFQNNIAFNQKCLNKAIKYFAPIQIVDFIIENSNLEIGLNEMKKTISSYNFPFFSYYLSQNLIKSFDSANNSLLNYAVCKNNFHITKFLCDLSSNFFKIDLINCKNIYKLSPLIQATSYGFLKIVKYLIKMGANYNEVDDVLIFFNKIFFCFYL